MVRRTLLVFLGMAFLMAIALPEASAAGRASRRMTRAAYAVASESPPIYVGTSVPGDLSRSPRTYRSDGWSTWDLGNFMGDWRADRPRFSGR